MPLPSCLSQSGWTLWRHGPGSEIGARRCGAQAVARLAAKATLRGQAPHAADADVLLRDAKGYQSNAFKIDLARRAIVRALTQPTFL